MSSFDPLALRRRAALGLLALGAVSLVSGCAFGPVYGEGGLDSTDTPLNFERPNNELEQIAYQTLAGRFRSSDSPDTPVLRLSVATSGGKPFTTGGTSLVSYTMTTTITAWLYRPAPAGQPAETLFRGTRQATASYRTSGQIGANNAAEQEARRQATRTAAENLRLAILGALLNKN
jgi:hypothetical protein